MKLGGHCCCSSKIPFNETVQGCIDLRWSCCQVFLGNEFTPDKRRELSEQDTNAVSHLCKKAKFRVYTHFPYTMNLVKPKTTKSLAGLQSELNTLNPFWGRIVIHPNSPTIAGGPSNKQISHPNYIPQYKTAIKTMINNLSLLIYPRQFSLLLEPPAGEGQKIGWSFDQISYIVKHLKKRKLPVGLCIDTCHSFAAGLSTFSGRKSVEKFFNTLKDIGALELVKAVHLNDSLCPYGSMKDSHASLCNGLIWQNKPRGFEAMVNKCKDLSIDIICETDGDTGVTCSRRFLDIN